MRRVELLTTEHCSLCERALDLLLTVPELRGWELITVDIAGSELLLDAFGEQIPVLRRADRTLIWPFTAAEVSRWLTTED